ncbi:small ribosomal subunit protein uS9m-like isoform X2 [Halichondria panicea]|uniref:small ribosomal subunit protein uS9m-like isoform X1 n=1 Tax=Halichondria panicea TaxID=6063 RepID=UPI00312B583F
MVLLRLLQGRWGCVEVTLVRNIMRRRALTTASHDSHPEPKSEEVRVEPSEEELSGAEPWMVDELQRYYQGRRRLADMMGVPPNKFTDKDVEDALRYLLPSRLFARDARPSMKHPFKIFPERKEALFGRKGRPLDAGFYTGSPAYHSLVYQIFEKGAELAASVEVAKEVKELLEATEKETKDESADTSSPNDITELPDKEAELSPTTQPEESEEETLSLSNDVHKTWIKKDAMENVIAEELSDKQYTDLIGRLSALASHSKSSTISSFLDTYRQPIFSYRSISHAPTPSADGSVLAVGKRKTATAVVTLRPGAGVISVNKKTFADYFPRAEDRHQVLYPMQVTELLGKYDITATVRGGGATGQSGAMRLGISKALLGFPGSHSDVLESKGLLVRDPRMVERKKPGQKKARKKFAWVKR